MNVVRASGATCPSAAVSQWGPLHRLLKCLFCLRHEACARSSSCQRSACAIHLTRLRGSHFACFRQYISIIVQSSSLIISVPHPQPYFFSLRQSYYEYGAELFLVRPAGTLDWFSGLAASELEDVGTAAGKIVQIRQRTPNCAAATAVECGVRCSRRIDNLNR
jgi:hypothetical protein